VASRTIPVIESDEGVLSFDFLFADSDDWFDVCATPADIEWAIDPCDRINMPKISVDRCF